MNSPFLEEYDASDDEIELINEALRGDKSSLEKIIKRHQSWIYNISFRMVCSPDDAEDITQEILIKIITKLSSYDPSKSSFRTWLYRIVANHVINMKKKKIEYRISDFGGFFDFEKYPDRRPTNSPENEVLVEELKIGCYLGSLLCLNRVQRLVFILGGIFKTPDSVGSRIIGISKANYRKILSRSRRELYSFMRQHCGLIDSSNRCHCENKISVHSGEGWLSPDRLKFYKGNDPKVRDVINAKIDDLSGIYHDKIAGLFDAHPFYDPEDIIHSILKNFEEDISP